MRKCVFVLILVGALFGAVRELPGRYDYFGAIKECERLGDGWRVMEIWELFELHGQVERFGKEKLYWSGNTLGEARIERDVRHESDIFVLDKELPAFAFFLQDGDITPTPKSVKAHVLCTNEPKIHQLDRAFSLQKDGSVIDRKSKIVWEPFERERDKKRLGLTEAREYCENLHLFGRSWRLPSLEELYGIVNYNYVKPSVNKKIFGHMHHKYYLTDDEFGDEEVYVVGFAVGSVATAPLQERYHFRCVSDMGEELAQTLGIYDPDWEIDEILGSKMELSKKLEAIERVLERPIGAKTAKKLLRFLKKEAPQELPRIRKLIKIRARALA